MNYAVQFFRGEKLYHSREYDLGLENAKHHARFMCKPYGATSARVVDQRKKVVFEYAAPSNDLHGEA